jgi:hypothetical protein
LSANQAAIPLANSVTSYGGSCAIGIEELL